MKSREQAADRRDGARYPGGILATCCVPWDREYAFMQEMFRQALRFIVRQTPLV